MDKRNYSRHEKVAPARERGLKSLLLKVTWLHMGRSREGAWIEILPNKARVTIFVSRSREGAWIEITVGDNASLTMPVAPARERGLKSLGQTAALTVGGRSREGAWIEIPTRWAVSACF